MKKLIKKRVEEVKRLVEEYRHTCKNMTFWVEPFKLYIDDCVYTLECYKNENRYLIQMFFNDEEVEVTQMVFFRDQHQNLDYIVNDLRFEQCDIKVDEHGVWVYDLV